MDFTALPAVVTTGLGSLSSEFIGVAGVIMTISAAMIAFRLVKRKVSFK